MQIGLVLGGGGARGFAHIGALRSLIGRGFEPVAIAGCSMGGIVGGLFAAGHSPDDIQEAFTNLKPYHLLDRSRLGPFLGGKGIAHQFEKYLPATFEELRIPLAVTAVDVQNGHLVVFNNGPLAPALRATSALPPVIEPVLHEGHILIDGGILNNLPVDVIHSLTRSKVVAVDVAAPPDRHIHFDTNLFKRLKQTLEHHQRLLPLELAMKTFDIPAAVLTKMRLALNPPSLLVRPALDMNLKVEDFKRLDEAVEVGFRDMEEALDANPEALTTAE